MKGSTRDVLLWLAGIGGAIVIVQAALGVLVDLVAGLLVGGIAILVLALGLAIAALAATRSRLPPDRPAPEDPRP
jgi:hypothetical protein